MNRFVLRTLSSGRTKLRFYVKTGSLIENDDLILQADWGNIKSVNDIDTHQYLSEFEKAINNTSIVLFVSFNPLFTQYEISWVLSKLQLCGYNVKHFNYKDGFREFILQRWPIS